MFVLHGKIFVSRLASQIIIPARDQSRRQTIKQTILRHDDCPFQLWLNYLQTHQNPTHAGSMIFKMVRLSETTVDDDIPMLIEVDADGNNMPMPRLIKIRPKRTLVGRHQKIPPDQQIILVESLHWPSLLQFPLLVDRRNWNRTWSWHIAESE